MNEFCRARRAAAAAAYRTKKLFAGCNPRLRPLARAALAACCTALISGALCLLQAEDLQSAAQNLLQLTRANRETLADDFPGFRAELKVHADGRLHRGAMLFRPPTVLEIELDDKDVRKRVKSTVRSLLSHRMRADGSPQDEPRLAEADLHPLGRRVLLGGKYDSAYRIRDERILEVDRRMGDSRLTISVLETETTASGKYLPTDFFVTVFDRETGAVESASVYRDVYRRIGGEYLPRSRRIISTREGRTKTLLVEWEAIELLPAAPKNGG